MRVCYDIRVLWCMCVMLSHSAVSASATLWTVSLQAPLSMGILQTRILEWVAVPFSRGSSQPRSQTQVSRIAGRFFASYHQGSPAAAARSLQSCPTLCDPRDGLLQGSPVPGILQASTLEWVSMSFSNAGKWKVKVKSLSRLTLSDPMDCSLPGFFVHGIFQARVLEWGAIAFSEGQCLTIS